MRFNVIHRCRGVLSILCKSVGSIFDSCDPCMNALNFVEVLLLKKSKLLLEIGCILNKLLLTSLSRWRSDFAWTVCFPFSAWYAPKESHAFSPFLLLRTDACLLSICWMVSSSPDSRWWY